jgi:hypothetical protein
MLFALPRVNQLHNVTLYGPMPMAEVVMAVRESRGSPAVAPPSPAMLTCYRRVASGNRGKRAWWNSLLRFLRRRGRAKVPYLYHVTFISARLQFEGVHNPG